MSSTGLDLDLLQAYFLIFFNTKVLDHCEHWILLSVVSCRRGCSMLYIFQSFASCCCFSNTGNILSNRSSQIYRSIDLRSLPIFVFLPQLQGEVTSSQFEWDYTMIANGFFFRVSSLWEYYTYSTHVSHGPCPTSTIIIIINV